MMLRRVRALEAPLSFSVWRNARATAALPSRFFCDSKDGGGSDGDNSGKADLPAKVRDLRVQRRSADLILPKTDVDRFRGWREDLPTNVNALEYKLFHPTDKSKQVLNKRLFQKPLEVNELGEDVYETIRPIEGGFNRALDQMRPKSMQKTKFVKNDVDAFYDVVIVGGGIMGLSAAYFLAQRVYHGLNILVVEKDPTYRTCSTTLSVAGIRQQFSLEENIEMSLFGADFLRKAKRTLHVHDVEMPNLNFQPHGYLFLATEKGAEQMERNHQVQTALGARVDLLSPAMLKRRFPWLNVDDIALGSLGMENEGHFDPWALLSMLKVKCQDLGVTFVHGDVYNFAHNIEMGLKKDEFYEKGQEIQLETERIKEGKVQEAHIYLHDGDVWPVTSCEFVIAGGPQSGHLAYLAGIGSGKGVLSVPLPVEPRKRYVYCVHAPKGPGLDCPLVVDPSGVYFRREGYGGHYLCGRSPEFKEEPGITDLEVDYDWFTEKVWPIMANRVPAFNELKVHSAWAGYYDYNYWDENAIIGPHIHHANVHFITGFSGHGLQQAPAAGRAISELILDGDDYQTLDLQRFSFERILMDQKAEEMGSFIV